MLVAVIPTLISLLFNPMAGYAFTHFLGRQYMVSVPDDVIAAARIDCASEWRTDRFIIPPLARPVLATPAIFTFMSASRVSLFATSEITGSTALTYGTRHAQETFHYYLSSTT